MNLLHPDHLRNPHIAYGQLRSVSPLLRLEGASCWALLDYASIKQALSDVATFSSRAEPMDWMIFYDPPHHTRLRALVSKAFTPAAIADLETRIARISRDLLEPLTARTSFDVTREFAGRLPVMVIAELLGIPSADDARFQGWSDAILGLSYTITGGEAAAVAVQKYGQATAEMDAYLRQFLADGSRSTGAHGDEESDSLLIRLSHAEIEGQKLSHSEILGFFQLLLLAGSETTANLIGNALICLIDHPEQLALLRGRPELMPGAIEETLRFRSPLQSLFRRTTGPVEMHGQTIPAGELVLMAVGSANRDPAVFEDPDRFDITRDPNPHIAFGHGVHFCLGAALARLEARIALSQFLERFLSFGYASSTPWPPRPTFQVHGPAQLELRVGG